MGLLRRRRKTLRVDSLKKQANFLRLLYFSGVYVVVNFPFRLIFAFPSFWGILLMNLTQKLEGRLRANRETACTGSLIKRKNKLTKINSKLQYLQLSHSLKKSSMVAISVIKNCKNVNHTLTVLSSLPLTTISFVVKAVDLTVL